MAVLFWHLVKSDLSSVSYCTLVHWASHFLQGNRNTRPCISGYPVLHLSNCQRILNNLFAKMCPCPNLNLNWLIFYVIHIANFSLLNL